MEIESIMGQAMDLLPAGWSDSAKLAVLAGVLAVCFVVPVILMIATFAKKRPRTVAVAAAGRVPAAAGIGGPDLNPNEWVSGNVIHYDRHKAFGFIRCDRVKGHVRFEAPNFKRAPRVGETVRFKGRYGGRRKPVAVIVEPVARASRAG